MSSPCVVMSPAYHNFDNHSTSPVNGGGSESNNVSPSSYTSANEIMRGHLTLLSSTHGPKPIILSVFRTSVDHFALVYPDNRRKAGVQKPAGCINLRGCTCDITQLGSDIQGFTLRPKKCDTSTSSSLIFLCKDPDSLPKWLASFEGPSSLYLGKRKIPRQCSLPIVSEEEE